MTSSIFLLAGVLSFLAVRMAPCAPEVYVSNRLDIADGDVTPSRSEGTDFGSAGLGRPGVRRTFVVGNTGPDPLTVGAVSVPGGFTLVNDLVGPISNGLAYKTVVTGFTENTL